jgi:hypothetical protein
MHRTVAIGPLSRRVFPASNGDVTEIDGIHPAQGDRIQDGLTVIHTTKVASMLPTTCHEMGGRCWGCLCPSALARGVESGHLQAHRHRQSARGCSASATGNVPAAACASASTLPMPDRHFRERMWRSRMPTNDKRTLQQGCARTALGEL